MAKDPWIATKLVFWASTKSWPTIWTTNVTRQLLHDQLCEWLRIILL